MKRIIFRILWEIYDLSGIRFIIEKIKPPLKHANARKTSSLILWLIGIYIALYGIASGRYENRIDIMYLLSQNNKNYAQTLIPE